MLIILRKISGKYLRLLSVKSNIFKKLIISTILFIVLVISGCGGDTWEAIVFPKKDNLLMHSSIGPFDTFKECRDASLQKLKDLISLDTGYFECGKNCKAGTSSYNRGCEDTMRGNVYK